MLRSVASPVPESQWDCWINHRHSAHKDLILGHEVVGTVVAVGPGEKKWKEGDYVGGGWHGGHDGTCKQCNRGMFQTCVNEAVNGVSKDGGCKSTEKVGVLTSAKQSQMPNIARYVARQWSVSQKAWIPPR